jgi:hypothetical protein
MRGHRRPIIAAIVDTRTAPSLFATDAPPAAAVARSVLGLCDDPRAADAWFAALSTEGIAVHSGPLELAAGGNAAADAWVLHLTHGLAAQLARLRALRGASPRLPLLAACVGLRDLDQYWRWRWAPTTWSMPRCRPRW